MEESRASRFLGDEKAYLVSGSFRIFILLFPSIAMGFLGLGCACLSSLYLGVCMIAEGTRKTVVV